jgi:dihydrodipicolinate reductase
MFQKNGKHILIIARDFSETVIYINVFTNHTGESCTMVSKQKVIEKHHRMKNDH